MSAEKKELRGFQLLGSGLRDGLRGGYDRRQFGKDLAAGALVGVVALPLAMALSIAVGLPPQQGLYTAIIAGFFVALLGGSKIQVVGPTAAFVAVLAPIVSKYGLQGLLLIGFLSGVLLAVMGLLRLGEMIQYIPFPVTTGFTAGVAVVIAGLQLKDVFGLSAGPLSDHLPERLLQYWSVRGTFRPQECAIALGTLLLLLVPRLPKRWLVRLPKLLRRLPAPIIALPLMALAALWLRRLGLGVDTLGDRFQTVIDGIVVRGIPQALPQVHWPWLDPNGDLVSLQLLREVFPSVLAVTALAAIESLLSAVVADAMVRDRHNPNSELLALGIGNMLVPFFGGIPATGAIARTATNFRFGGRTPVAAMTHAVTVFLAVLVFAPWLAYLPMASLAALLLLVAWNMSELDHFKHVLKHGPWMDGLVLLACFGLTIIFDMATAVMAGTLLAALFLVQKTAESTRGGFHDVPAGLPAPLPKDVVVYRIVGPMFFGSSERAIGALRSIGQEVRAVIFDAHDVPKVDISGFVALETMVDEMSRLGIKAVFVGLPEEVMQFLRRAGLQEAPARLSYCATMAEAFQRLEIRMPALRRRPGRLKFHPLQRARQGARNSKRQAG
jgi:SulP family sulfate permease